MIKKALSAFLIAAMLFTIGFMWYNSMQPVVVSQKISQATAEAVEKITYERTVAKEYNAFVNELRKAAHMIEFFALGFELTLLIIVFGKNKWQWVFNAFSFSLIIAVLDEAIQIASGRGSAIEDVFIDMAGAVAAILLTLFVYFTVEIIRRKIKCRN